MSLPEPAPSARDVDWLGLSRRAAAAAREVVEGHRSPSERARETGRGEGGDVTLAIDRAAEDAIFAELERAALPLTAISEERGQVELAGGGPVHVVIDPVDGSLNAKRRLPFHCVSIAIAQGRTMADVDFGYVLDLGCGDEWWARRGDGAHHNGERLERVDATAAIELLGIEAASPPRLAAAADLIAGSGARRVRCLGAIALTLCSVAAARLDAMISLAPCRSVDAAAGQLIVREAGGAVAFPDAGEGLGDCGLGLEMRSRVAAAPGPAQLSALVAAAG